MKFIAGLRVWVNGAMGKTPQVFPKIRGSANRRVDLHLPLIYLSRRGMRRFHESRIVLQLSGRKQAVILIVTSRKEEHHGLVSRAVDRGRATRRQRGTVLSSQPPNSRKDARALVVAHRAHA